MRVIKLGGSLLSDKATLEHCLITIDQQIKSPCIIVPGGGVFADQVRIAQKKWGFDDVAAHHMAILAMQQMALLLNNLNPDFVLAKTADSIQQKVANHSVIIWMPDIDELDDGYIKPSWDITSDSLAAWLANQLSVTELILVKSAQIPLNLSVQQLQEKGLLDKAFFDFINHANYKITLLNKHQFNEYIVT